MKLNELGANVNVIKRRIYERVNGWVWNFSCVFHFMASLVDQ